MRNLAPIFSSGKAWQREERLKFVLLYEIFDVPLRLIFQNNE